MNLKIGLLNSQKIMTFYNVPPGFKKYAVYQQTHHFSSYPEAKTLVKLVYAW